MPAIKARFDRKRRNVGPVDDQPLGKTGIVVKSDSAPVLSALVSTPLDFNFIRECGGKWRGGSKELA